MIELGAVVGAAGAIALAVRAVQKVQRNETRLDAMEKAHEAAHNAQEKQIADVKSLLCKLDAKLDTTHREVMRSVSKVHGRIDKMGERMQAMDKRLVRVETKLNGG